MPTYDYACKECGHRFEVFQRMSDEALKVCPDCNGKIQRIISGGTGLIFKGSGFYITDYKNGANGKKSSGKSDEKSDEKSSKDVKKDGKTAGGDKKDTSSSKKSSE